ncbi:hypothetical protein [Robertkochia solimangrovi]|uniref:hypothetical protein n=1 Tax=Robertkochia solimangrovi TaxID=2213046 RepID=UPI001F55457A|nr:hypothetical protein [Robertkochia solimangrovi]
MLIEHFIEHQQRDTAITFYNYLEWHYWGNDLNDNDQDRDMQLPFKKIDAGNSQLVITPNQNQQSTIVHSIPIQQSSIFDKQIFYNNPQFGDLFRPPIA